jgi:hypothetical protein
MAQETSRRRQKWSDGDVFLVPLNDGMCVVGQVIGRERQALNSVGVALFDIRIACESDVSAVGELAHDKIFSVLLVTPDLLNNGVWRVIGNKSVNIPHKKIPYENLRLRNWVGASIKGSGNINEFVNAYYGLVPWDDWHDPVYLDTLLLSPDKKPSKIMLKGKPD